MDSRQYVRVLEETEEIEQIHHEYIQLQTIKWADTKGLTKKQTKTCQQHSFSPSPILSSTYQFQTERKEERDRGRANQLKIKIRGNEQSKSEPNPMLKSRTDRPDAKEDQSIETSRVNLNESLEPYLYHPKLKPCAEQKKKKKRKMYKKPAGNRTNEREREKGQGEENKGT